MKTRIYFLDNLRTFLIFLVIVLHSAICYAPVLQSMWIVNDPSKSNGLVLFVIYIDIFVMFMMFFISGYFVPQSLKGKTTWAFIKAKFNRIMVPWIVAVFTLIPAYKFIFLYSRGLPQEEWFTYFHLFAREGGSPAYFADGPAQSWLWFLPVLFLFQILYAALAKTSIFKLKISLKTAVISTFVIGLAFSMVISRLDLNGWFDSPVLHFQKERILIYFLFFLLGSLCYKLKVFETSQKSKGLFIISNIVLGISLTVFTVVAMNFFQNIIDPSRNIFIISEFADAMMYYGSVLLSTFSILYVLIHIFKNRVNKTSRVLGAMSKNSYAVYIIHMIVIGLLSLMLLNLSIPPLVKFCIVAILSFIISNLLVSAYKTTIGKKLSHRCLRNAILPAAILFSILIYVQKEETLSDEVMVTSSTRVPEVGIHMAAIQGNIDAIRQHIAAGTDLDAAEPSAGSSALISASLFGKTEVVSALIAAGADVNFQNKEGSTALHTAAFFCRKDITEILLAHGANQSLRNKEGSTALESVLAPWELVKGIYVYFGNTLGPLGLELDYEYLESSRPEIAETLMNQISK